VSNQFAVRTPARISVGDCPCRVRVVRRTELAAHVDAWQKLSDAALFPNIAYEPWMALPALQNSPGKDNLYFVLVFDSSGKDLWAFIPLELQSKCLHLPIRNLALWQHRFCYVTAPLLHAAHARDALDAFWRWFESNPLGVHVLDTNWLLADGSFHALWIDFALGRVSVLLNDFPRALYRAGGSLSEYLSLAVSRKSQNEFQRRERRLAEIGKLEYKVAQTSAEADAWIGDFLRLEASGWKGHAAGGRAFATYQPDAVYFRAVTLDAFRRGRAMLLALTLDGKPIAMRHTVFAGDGAFAFRTAYDEKYAKHSPGTLLELEVMRRMSVHPHALWMDSCAAPRHVLLNRIWRERRMIRRALFSDGSFAGDLLLSGLPLIRWAGKLVRPNKTPGYLQISTHKGDNHDHN
jgi:CelD/BcsL family acetyltransferase involved in cellulose biosynthesis